MYHAQAPPMPVDVAITILRQRSHAALKPAVQSDSPQPVGGICRRPGCVSLRACKLESNIHILLATKPWCVLLANLREIVIDICGKSVACLDATHLAELNVPRSEIILHFLSGHSGPKDF